MLEALDVRIFEGVRFVEGVLLDSSHAIYCLYIYKLNFISLFYNQRETNQCSGKSNSLAASTTRGSKPMKSWYLERNSSRLRLCSQTCRMSSYLSLSSMCQW